LKGAFVSLRFQTEDPIGVSMFPRERLLTGGRREEMPVLSLSLQLQYFSFLLGNNLGGS
jgi:hypothetical protein